MFEKPFDHYLLFEPLDFVMDEDFQRWALQQTPEQDAYWQSLKVAFPTKIPAIELGYQVVQQMRVTDWQTLTPHQLHDRFGHVLTRIDGSEARVAPLHHRWWVRVAALLVLGLLGWQTYRYGWASTAYQTAFGQQQRVLLPDQTVVTLAAHSRLTVPGRWRFSQQREVWLTGEAYFEVTKQAGNLRAEPLNFVVHARELNVEVLGTRFNVSTFRRKTTVLLDEGKVRLTALDQPGQVVTLRPGQTAERPAQQPTIRVAPTTDPTLTAWRDGRLLFRAATLAELSQRVHEVYGQALVFDGEGWTNATFTGELPTTDAALMARIIAETFGTDIAHEDNRLILRKQTLNP